jgi:lipopolysaccharide transport system ATP-binding protein
MSDIVIRAEGLGKQYIIGHQAQRERYTALRDVLAQQARGLWSKTRDLVQGKPIIAGDTLEEVWALRDVSFEIRRGEAVGIIGRNGAGKSTLLKILSRITEPSAGRVTLRGRVASLLEVGTGFHPELTGRENIYLNGAILGMTRAEIRRKFDEIVAFAEVEKYLDTPVKRYSSGMYVRLAFAVAAHLEPEILVVDEVLAVGDAAFQKKCLGKMSDVAGEGRTVLFVSHNMNAVEQLCATGLLLDEGALVQSGQIRNVIQQYLFGHSQNRLSTDWFPMNGNLHNRWFSPTRLFLCDASGKPVANPISNDSDCWIQIEGVIDEIHPLLTIGYAIYTENGLTLYWSYQTDTSESDWPQLSTGKCVLRSKLPTRLLNEGQYLIELIGSLHFVQWLFAPRVNSPSIRLIIQGGLSDSPYWMVKREGLLAPVLKWTTIAGSPSTEAE